MMDSDQNSDDDMQAVVNAVFQSSSVKQLRVSEIMASLYSNDSRDAQKKFLRELKRTLDPHNKDAIIDDEEFYLVFKSLVNKYQGMDFISSSISPVKFVTSDLNISKHDCSSYSLSESDFSSSSSPTTNAEVELLQLQDECDSLRSYVKRLEETKNALIKQLSLSEDKASELENRCEELEKWKTNCDLTNRLYFDNNNWASETEANESKTKELESRISQLEKELMSARKQCDILEDENSHLLTTKNDWEEVQRHAEKLHKENEEYALFLQLKNIEIADLKSEYEEKVAMFNKQIAIMEEEFKTHLAAVQESVQPPISLESSFEESCLKDELGGSFFSMNISLTTSAVEASTVETTAVDASALGASTVEASTVEATAVDASALGASAVDASALGASDGDASALGASDGDASALGASAGDASALGASAGDASALGASAVEVDSSSSTADASTEVTARVRSVSASAGNADLQSLNLEVKPVHNCCMLCKERKQGNLYAAQAHYTQTRPWNIWKIILAVVAYTLHNCFLGSLVICAIIFLLTPYLNYNFLMRERPWFVSVSTGSASPPV